MPASAIADSHCARELLVRVLDALPDALTLRESAGAEVFTNGQLRLLLETDVESDRLREELEVIARSQVLHAQNCDGREPVSPLVREVHTQMRVYRLRSTYLGTALSPRQPLVLIRAQEISSEPLSDDEIQQRYGLTAQELRVSRLLIDGLTNRQIADLLVLSPHTIRHHVERVLGKLNAHSRTEVRGMLCNGVARAGEPAARPRVNNGTGGA